MSPETLLALFTFFAGLILGHWLNIGRERRKERNDAAAVVRGVLIGHRGRVSSHDPFPTRAELDRFEQQLSPRERAGFASAIENYCKAKSEAEYQSPTSGEVLYHESAEIAPALERLIAFTAHR